MKLFEAKQLKIGDILYHHSVRHPNGKRCTTTVKSEVRIYGGFPLKWDILVQDDDSTEIRALSGKYAFNWSTTCPPSR